MSDLNFSGIYGIVDTALTSDVTTLVEELLGAGVRIIQYRAKNGIQRNSLNEMLERTRAVGAVLIVNDDLDAALVADGWHAGQEDLALCDAAAVRERLDGRLFGISCGVAEEARAAQAYGADYVGVGPFATTSTKADAGHAIGACGVAAVVEAVRIPVVAIGGIDLSNLADVARGGAAMAAVISAIALAPDRRAMARTLVERWAQLQR